MTIYRLYFCCFKLFPIDPFVIQSMKFVFMCNVAASKIFTKIRKSYLKKKESKQCTLILIILSSQDETNAAHTYNKIDNSVPETTMNPFQHKTMVELPLLLGLSFTYHCLF